MSAPLQLSDYYKIPTLKEKMIRFREIATYYGLKIKVRKKQDYIQELSAKMKELYYVGKIQRCARIRMRRALIKCHGPGFRSLQSLAHHVLASQKPSTHHDDLAFWRSHTFQGPKSFGNALHPRWAKGSTILAESWQNARIAHRF
jgi:hypothetical protein